MVMVPTRIAFRYGRRTLLRIFRRLPFACSKLSSIAVHPKREFTVDTIGLVIISIKATEGMSCM